MRTRVPFILLAVIVLATGTSAWSMDAFASDRSSAIYPAPVKAKAGGALRLCPSSEGLVAFDSAGRKAAGAAALGYGRKSLASDLANSDRAWRREVEVMWRRGTHPVPVRVRGVKRASANPYHVIVRRSCGSGIVARSLTVTVGPVPAPGERECTACELTFFFVDRRGHALIYYIY